MNKLLLLLLFLFVFNCVIAQEKVVVDSLHKNKLIALPAVGYGKEKGIEFGAVTLYTFYTDQGYSITRNSSISASALYSTKKQTSLSFKLDMWRPSNNYHYLTEIKFKNQPFNFYGIGNTTFEVNKDIIIQQQFRFLIETEKKTGNYSFTGLSLGFENYAFSDKKAGGIYETSPVVVDKDGGSMFFLGALQSFDSRNSINYPTKGVFIKLNYNLIPDFFGGENFTGSQIKLNGRYFMSFTKKAVLALNTIYQTMQGKNIPFYLLPQLGNDEMMRGYYSGRYRDQNLLATQAEIRYRFLPFVGAVAFAGTGLVYRNSEFSLSDLKPNYGAGVRYFFDVNKGLAIRLDYGIGEKLPNEKRQTGFYISIAEAF